MATKKTTKEKSKRQDYFDLPRALGNCVDYGMVPRDYPDKEHLDSLQKRLKTMKKKMSDK
jgi:hypothetical protein